MKSELIDTYCKKHPSDKACICAYTSRVVLDKYSEALSQWNAMVKDIKTLNANKDRTYNMQWVQWKKGIEMHKYNMEIERKRTSCEPWDNCNNYGDFSEDVGSTSSGCGFQFGLGILTRRICKRPESLVERMSSDYAKYSEPSKPTYSPLPVMPTLNATIQCCINNITDVNDISNVEQQCKQTIENHIQQSAEDRDRKFKGKDRIKRTRQSANRRQDKKTRETKREQTLISLIVITLCILAIILVIVGSQL